MKKAVMKLLLDWLDTRRRNDVLRAMVSTKDVDIARFKAASDAYEEVYGFIEELLEEEV